MRKTTIAATATGLLLGSTALAGPIEDIVAQFQTYGYDSIEISQTGNLVKIEGVRGGTEREIVFDTATNTILKDETGPAGDDEDDDGEVDDDEDVLVRDLVQRAPAQKRPPAASDESNDEEEEIPIRAAKRRIPPTGMAGCSTIE